MRSSKLGLVSSATSSATCDEGTLPATGRAQDRSAVLVMQELALASRRGAVHELQEVIVLPRTGAFPVGPEVSSAGVAAHCAQKEEGLGVNSRSSFIGVAI